jgi:hypothetical protein
LKVALNTINLNLLSSLFNFSHDKVKEEKTGIDETEKQKTDPEIDDNGWYYCSGQL